MSNLTSSSTIADAISQWKNNSSYRRNGSATEAELFREACDWLITLRPSRARHGAQTIEFNVDQLKEQKDEAEAYLAANTSTGSTSTSRRRNTLHAKFSSNFRG